MQQSILTPQLVQFMSLINTCDAITLDGGPLLSEWILESEIDYKDPKDLVLTCKYEGGEGQFEESFNVENIDKGVWDNSGEVLELLNTRGELAHIRFFKLNGMNKDGTVMDKTMSDLSADFLSTLNMFTNDTMDEFIQLLKQNGWQESEIGGAITHPTLGDQPAFTSWSNLIKFAINNSAASNKQAKVYVEVYKGICSWNADGNVDLHMRDLDIEPDAIVPDDFKHLAASI